MNNNNVKKIVIVGGGTAGWMTAAALVRLLSPQHFSIQLVESDQIGTVGVGEATLPHLRFFNQRLGIDEAEFIRATNATFKAGIEFVNWGERGESYIHPFGDYGASINNLGFHHYWLKARQLGLKHKIDEYSLPVKFCEAGKFDFPLDDNRSINSTYSYAYHIDASEYARYLRSFAEPLGLKRIEGKVTRVEKCKNTGDITSLALASGQQVHGDFFIDCSGFRSLVIGEHLGVEFDSWKHWLPTDRAIAAPTTTVGDPKPYTQASAQKAGWQWCIPLQHRTGNGHVYSSEHLGEDEAQAIFRKNLLGELLRDPMLLRFEAGKRAHSWEKNCVAIGLSAGFLEPLESTSIYLIQIAIMKFMECLSGDETSPVVRDEFNKQMNLEYERTRDFLILHYHATRRTDSSFWDYVRTMSIPNSLQHKMDLFKQQAYVSPYAYGLFLEPSWIAVYLGQGVYPEAVDSRVSAMPEQGLFEQLESFRAMVSKSVDRMPSHQQSLQRLINQSAQAVPRATASMSLYGRRNK